MRKTKLIATLGPSSWSPKMIERLSHAGVNIFRLNFSHGTAKLHSKLIRTIRSVASTLRQPIGILADLPGPKLRIGDFKDGQPVFLTNKNKCTLTTKKIEGSSSVIPISFTRLPHIVQKKDRILLADGKLELVVLNTTSTDIECEIIVGGELRNHQGINIPDRHLDIPSFTFQDKKAIDLLQKFHVDFVALSFVQTAHDIERAKSMIKQKKMILPVIAKIEKPQAVKHILPILDHADAIMIARGDLGVELPTSDLPVLQKHLIRLASEKKVPVITATQMLESMMSNSRPTRAETTDIANAIWDGTDAVMLSGETATGDHPLLAVQTMDNIIRKAEQNDHFAWHANSKSIVGPELSVLKAACEIANPNEHKAIVTYTETGHTAIMMSKLRPKLPIYAITHKPHTREKLTLAWGVKSFVAKRGHSADKMFYNGDQVLLEQTKLKKGDLVIVAAGTQLTSGATNMMKVHRIGFVR